MKKVAFVVQRCGIEVNGGAEFLCRRIAERMSQYWDVEILTTCALDYMTWEDYYQPGLLEVNGVKIRRFPVDRPRDVESFNQFCGRLELRAKEASVEEQEAWMKAQGPYSSKLMNYIEQHEPNYDAFIFFTYLYATTYFLLPKVQHKAFLAPCAHDEWPIYMSTWDFFFKKPRGFIFNTLEEKQFLQSRFFHIGIEGEVAGVAVDPPESWSADRFRQQYRIEEPFLLYVGRIDLSKGCGTLFENFMKLRATESTPRKLVLLGKSAMSVPHHPDIVPLGFVDEQTKWDALSACDLLVMPSPYESLSMVLLEAWMLGKPVLVNGGCEVLVGQCRRSQGGLWHTNYYEFQAALNIMSTTVKRQLGIQGKRFVETYYSWGDIEKKYLNLLEK